MAEEDSSGAISPSGRFARMEASLLRIEDKLDTKADAVRLSVVEGRVAALETSDSNKVAVASAVKSAADGRYRTLLWVVGLMQIAQITLVVGIAVAGAG